MSTSHTKAERTRVLNDNFRTTFIGGQVMTTPIVAELPLDLKARLLLAGQSFTEFSVENDPYGEHDFGAIEVGGERYFFKIDYYDLQCRSGSEDPSDPSKTTRVLTIVRVDEY
jgi:hypothetical protein